MTSESRSDALSILLYSDTGQAERKSLLYAPQGRSVCRPRAPLALAEPRFRLSVCIVRKDNPPEQCASVSFECKSLESSAVSTSTLLNHPTTYRNSTSTSTRASSLTGVGVQNHLAALSVPTHEKQQDVKLRVTRMKTCTNTLLSRGIITSGSPTP